MIALFDRIRRDFARGFAADPAELLDLLRATAELALARVRLAALPTRELLDRACAQDNGDHAPLSDRDQLMAERVALAIGRMGARLPWNTRCLVQALAAQRWLARRGIATSLFIGVRNPPPATFEAHAWLARGETVITGGDNRGYEPLMTPAAIHALRRSTMAS